MAEVYLIARYDDVYAAVESEEEGEAMVAHLNESSGASYHLLTVDLLPRGARPAPGYYYAYRNDQNKVRKGYIQQPSLEAPKDNEGCFYSLVSADDALEKLRKAP